MYISARYSFQPADLTKLPFSAMSFGRESNAKSRPSPLDPSLLESRLIDLNPLNRIKTILYSFAYNTLITTSGGRNSGLLVELVNQIQKHRYYEFIAAIPIVFLDTRNHPPETLTFLNSLRKNYPNLTFKRYTYDLSEAQIKSEIIQRFYQQPEGKSALKIFLEIAKVRTIANLMSQVGVQNEIKYWIAGNRRDQSAERAQLPLVAKQTLGEKEIIKFFPLADITNEWISDFKDFFLYPEHPLPKNKFPSIGTILEMKDYQESQPGMEKDNRLVQECGIHEQHPVLKNIPVVEVEDWNHHLTLSPHLQNFIREADNQ